jgi:hypothetical protein
MEDKSEMEHISEYVDYILNKKNREFDRFEPFQKTSFDSFQFVPIRYEVWQGGKLSASGIFTGIIQAYISNINSNNIRIKINDESVLNHISADFNFSTIFTQTDRIQFAEIPPAKHSDCNGLNALRLVTGTTCNDKIFDELEPYCAGLFLQGGKLKKMTFSFNSPVRLIEFYT